LKADSPHDLPLVVPDTALRDAALQDAALQDAALRDTATRSEAHSLAFMDIAPVPSPPQEVGDFKEKFEDCFTPT